MKCFQKIGILFFLTLLGYVAYPAQAVTLAQRLSGRILLQVESHGEAWYVNPVDSFRYYMKDGATAYEMLRSFGLGISNKDFAALEAGSASLATRLKGRILLKVEDLGKAYYVNPVDGKLNYLKDGAAAYQIMRALSLGITNTNLAIIPSRQISNQPKSSEGIVPSPPHITTDTSTSVPTPTPNPIPALVPKLDTLIKPIVTNIPKKHLTVMAVNNGASSRYTDNSWEKVMKVKQNDVIQIFDVALWDNGVAGNPSQISLYKFDGSFDPYQAQYANGGSSWVAYRENFNILNIQTPPSCKTATGPAYYECSTAYYNALKRIFETIVSTQPAEHYGIKYGGHGSNAGLFENMLSANDSTAFLAYTNSAIGKKLDFLDWSTNCDMGNSEVLNNEYFYTEYILSSDIPRGGFAADWANDYDRLKPEANLGRFFVPSKSIRQSLVDMVDSERQFWETSTVKNDMIAKHLKQSLSIYDTSKYLDLKNAISLDNLASGDVFEYIKNDLLSRVQKFSDFRFHYVSNKDFFAWDRLSNGFKKATQ